MISIKMFFVFLILNFVTLTWDYGSGGSDWTGNSCESSSKVLSPINLDLTVIQCRTDILFDVYFNETFPTSANLIFSENPKTPVIELSQDLGVLIYHPDNQQKQIYKPSKIIFRLESEHQINGNKSPLEAQIFFTSSADLLPIVVSILFEKGDVSSLIFKDFVSELSSSQMNSSSKESDKYSINLTNLSKYNNEIKAQK